MTAHSLDLALRSVSAWPISRHDEEAQWVARARAGEEAAFGWLLARYRHRAIRLAAHVLQRPADAEDVAQEAFVRAFRGLPGLRGDAGFAGWLFRIVVRL